MAHNGKSFDHQFILNHILTNTNITPDLIIQGTKIILMVMENIKLLDSINYFHMALIKLPKTFGLSDIYKKGYFSHLFNTEANKNYIRLYPDSSYNSASTMKIEDRNDFLIGMTKTKINNLIYSEK